MRMHLPIGHANRARFFLTAVLVLLLLPAAGLPASVPDRCPNPCEDDDDEGRCTPACADCPCCVPPGPAVGAQPFDLPPPAPVTGGPADLARDVAAPAPRDILHVPRTLRAV